MLVQDLHDLVRLLEEHPDWRAELRRILLGDELLQMPELVRQILQVLQRHTEILEHHSEIIGQLLEAQRRTDQRMEELIEAQKRTDQRMEELIEAQKRTDQRMEELIEAQKRTDQRMEGLVEAQKRTDQRMEELIEAQKRTDQRMEELIEAQKRTDQRMEQLVEAQRQMAHQLNRLMEWQRGEAGRREGEQFEAQTVRRAVNVFMGGRGGSPAEPHIRELLGSWLEPYYAQGRIPEPQADPTLANIIWWKDSEVFVVEVSLKVDLNDVERARMRAETLREVGINAIPAVVGEEWAADDVQSFAMTGGVEWMVARGVSPGFLRFRQMRPAERQE